MVRTLAFALALLTAGITLPAQAQLGNKTQPVRIRQVSGRVLGSGDAPVKDAVVYLKNIKTLAIKTLISDGNGEYSFKELSPNVDYQLWAESNGQKSSIKTISSFDSRSDFKYDLHIKD